MNLDERLIHYKNTIDIKAEEKNIQDTIAKAKEAFYTAQMEGLLSYREFLWIQFKILRKRWWLFQFLLLCAAGGMLYQTNEREDVQKIMGITAALFVILIIPELWKNRSCRCMEVEGACYYSLRQIYAARLVLFGGADLLLLMTFAAAVAGGRHYGLMEFLTSFVLPMLVTACICFGVFGSRRMINSLTAIMLCMIWSTVWLFIVINQIIYSFITPPVLLAAVTGAVLFLCTAVYRGLYCASDIAAPRYNGMHTAA